MKQTPSLLAALLLAPLADLHAADNTKPVEPISTEFKAKLQVTLVKHLNQLLKDDGGFHGYLILMVIPVQACATL